jgi:hypothetical protein
VKKLIEGLPFYRDKLHEKVVYTRFQEILVKVSVEFLIKKTIITNNNQQARSNKAANKSDAELNEFENVCCLPFHFICLAIWTWSARTHACTYMHMHMHTPRMHHARTHHATLRRLVFGSDHHLISHYVCFVG